MAPVNDLERHKGDAYAHGALVGRLDQEAIGPLEKRVSSLENWRWWVLGIGGLLVFEIPIAVIFLK